ncbi:MAG: glycosyl hydrolase family 18 protein [Bacillota bacterium]|nr:glycosyl hydrolase family 18 protein [Bacillota bacterium]
MPEFNRGCHIKNRFSGNPNFLPIAVIAIIIFLFAILLFFLFIRDEPPEKPGVEDEVPPNPPLVLVWEYAPVAPGPAAIGPMKPVQIVSPTWFNIINKAGTIENHVDKNYLNWARERGYEIWPLVTNSFDPEITAIVLSRYWIRRKIVNELIDLALYYDFDGINIDFENFHAGYRNLFTRFISELAERCREESLVLSVDVTMISSSEYWSTGYDRGALAAEADYLILMAYDEHYSASPTAGSVSSLPWVERGLRRILQEVPAEKLILGVPFYTRLWEIDNSGEEPLVLDCWSFSMQRASEIMEENETEIYWDLEAKQHVASYSKDDLDYIMWLEDTASMYYRLELVERYRLAGIAGWRRGLEKDAIWYLIEDWMAETYSDPEAGEKSPAEGEQ